MGDSCGDSSCSELSGEDRVCEGECDDLIRAFGDLCFFEPTPEMDPQVLADLVKGAVEGALAAQAAQFEERLKTVEDRYSTVSPEVECYEDATINPAVRCEEPLDVMKSLPTYTGLGSVDDYVSWRTAARNAFKIYESYEGSSKYYQALILLRNKITQVADATLTSFATPLNFKAILSRLDRHFADKRPLHLIEQQLSTLRQGNKSVTEYYEEVQKVLCSLTNKTAMTYSLETATAFNEKYRRDALNVFISGLKRTLSETLFAARPKDLPSALVLAEELEWSRERYNFASSFSRANDAPRGNQVTVKRDALASPNYKPAQAPAIAPRWPVPPPHQPTAPRPGPVEPMDVDLSASSRFRNNQFKRPLSGVSRPQQERARQRINNLGVEVEDVAEEEEEYLTESAAQEPEDFVDHLNFLGDGPCSRSSGAL